MLLLAFPPRAGVRGRRIASAFLGFAETADSIRGEPFMRPCLSEKKISCFLLTGLLLLSCSACFPNTHTAVYSQVPEEPAFDTSDYLVAIEDEPDTVDFQCTTIHYTIAQNVFNRLVEMETDNLGRVQILPSLAESWKVSEDRKSYSFHLREDVTFSNGSPLTASDVLYTFTRLLTHPDSQNRDIVEMIEGADRLEQGLTDRLDGFSVEGDYNFTITLHQPFEAFLPGLSVPGASILDEQTVRGAGDRFGIDPAWTVGTGSFILTDWEPAKGMLLRANPDCFMGAPKCAGLDLRFVSDPEEARAMFERGDLDVLDLDEVGNSAEYFYHGDIYQSRLFTVQRIGITYIALNESVEPLNNVSVRKALQRALNRSVLLDAIYGGNGNVENGILCRGLYGANPELPEIPFDPEAAQELLEKAGYPDGFDLTVSVKSTSTQREMWLMQMVASMWSKIGVRAEIEVLDEDVFMQRRKTGKLACYSATWTADCNDPDNFMYTFFGSRKNTTFRSLCYPRDEIMQRVHDARTIPDSVARIAEYRKLERIIVQDDAAWIPLFSRLHFYVTSPRVHGISASWNGSVKNRYRDISLDVREP